MQARLVVERVNENGTEAISRDRLWQCNSAYVQCAVNGSRNAGDEDKREAGARISCALRELDAGHPTHHDVGEDQVARLL